MTDDEITKIADQCGMYECHDNGRISGSTVLEFARAILATAAPRADERNVILEEAAEVAERCYVRDSFRFILGTEAAKGIRELKAAPGAAAAPAQTEPSDATVAPVAVKEKF